jgi:hypothetical protein
LSDHRRSLLPRLRADATPDEAARALNANGALIIEDLLSATELKEVERQLAPWFAKAPHGEGLFFGRKTRRFSAVLAKARASWALAINPLVLGAIERGLRAGVGGACDAVQLNLTQAIGIEPGQDIQAPHRDDSLFPFPHEFELMVNAMWTLDAFTAENGATLVAPGSNRWDRTRTPTLWDFEPASAPAGSVILWLGSTLHGGGANRSEAMRRGLTLSYSLGWLSQAEKLLLSIPPNIAREMPERLQRLIGYQVHKPNLGWVEEHDPLEWLNGTVRELAPAQDHLTPAQAARVEAFHAMRAAQ